MTIDIETTGAPAAPEAPVAAPVAVAVDPPRRGRGRPRLHEWCDVLPDGLRTATLAVLTRFHALRMPGPRARAATRERSREDADAAKTMYTEAQRQARTTLGAGREYGTSFYRWQGLMYSDPSYVRGNVVVVHWYHQTEAYRFWRRGYDQRKNRMLRAGCWEQDKATRKFRKAFDAFVGAIVNQTTYGDEDRSMMRSGLEAALCEYNTAGHYCGSCLVPTTLAAPNCPRCGKTEPWEVDTWIRQAYADADAKLHEKTARVLADDDGEDLFVDFREGPDDEPPSTVYALHSDDHTVEMENHMANNSPAMEQARGERYLASTRRKSDKDNPERAKRHADKAEWFDYWQACDAAEEAGELPPPKPTSLLKAEANEKEVRELRKRLRNPGKVFDAPTCNRDPELMRRERELDEDRARRTRELEQELRAHAIERGVKEHTEAKADKEAKAEKPDAPTFSDSIMADWIAMGGDPTDTARLAKLFGRPAQEVQEDDEPDAEADELEDE